MSPDDLAAILDELGQRLGPTGERVFALAVRQVYIDTILWTFMGGGLIVGAVYLWRRIYRTGDSIDQAYGTPIAVILAAVGVFIIAACGLSPALNAEYAAIRNLLSAVGR